MVTTYEERQFNIEIHKNMAPTKNYIYTILTVNKLS